MSEIKRANLLLPCGNELSKWSVIACDQFTSSPEYWEETEKSVGDAPSTLRMILPEAYLGTEKAEDSPRRTAEKMHEYLTGGVLREIPGAFLYVERTVRSGKIRHGILAAVDLEAYDYRPESDADIKATEKTVEDRLWKRLEVRKTASLELPHILIFYNDPACIVSAELEKDKQSLSKEYDFDLMQGGGHIKGWSVQGEAAERLEKQLNGLKEKGENREGLLSAAFAVGDGNHSLATAKLNWEEIRKTLPEEEKETHPARYALAELVNVYDTGVEILPIHRIIKNADNEGFIGFCEKWYRDNSRPGAEKTVTVGIGGQRAEIPVSGLGTGELVELTDRCLQAYLEANGGEEDYIHDDDTAVKLGSEKGSGYVLLPEVQREEIFDTVAHRRIFPKKCFSIGSAKDKRYYLECRQITSD